VCVCGGGAGRHIGMIGSFVLSCVNTTIRANYLNCSHEYAAIYMHYNLSFYIVYKFIFQNLIAPIFERCYHSDYTLLLTELLPLLPLFI
jgi:hypothetical protein